MDILSIGFNMKKIELRNISKELSLRELTSSKNCQFET